MASAGRILIMPKGNYNAEIEYEMLDLVFHNGKSWVAKKTAQGIEPSEAEMSADYWMKMCEGASLAEVYNRISAIENQMLSTLSLDDIDLSGYATKSELTNYATKSELGNYSTLTDLLNVNNNINNLNGRVGALEPNVASLMANMATLSNAKFYIGTLTPPDPTQTVTFHCDFAPKMIFVLGTPNGVAEWFSITIIIPEKEVGITLAQLGNMTMSDFQVTRNGNDTVIKYVKTASNEAYPPTYICNGASMKYTYICIG